MSDTLDIHPASRDELAAAHRNVFDIWSRGLSLNEHVRFRLNSPKHRLAAWYVGCIDGCVVVSLGCYPLRFRVRGREAPGIAVGSVYTVANFRRRSFAAQLLAWAEDYSRQRGSELSLLYSDIDPGYYARMGYVPGPSLAGWADPRALQPKAPSSYELIEIDARTNVERLSSLYARYHDAAPLSIARDAAYWRALLERSPDDRFFALVNRAGDDWQGYVRVAQGVDASWRITDYALNDERPELGEALYLAVAARASEQDVLRVGGWLPDNSTTRKLFALSPRRQEITMIKPLVGPLAEIDQLVASTDSFCEIDHV